MNDSIPKMPPEWKKVPNIFYNNADQLPDKSHEKTIGFHGTSLSRVNYQIQKGFIEDRGELFFIAQHPKIARIYAHIDNQTDAPVVLEVEGPKKRVFVHTLFNTEYFAGFEKLKINGMYQQSAEFINANKHENYRLYHPKRKDKFYKIYRTALDLINKMGGT